MNEINTSLQKLMIGIQKCENADDDISDYVAFYLGPHCLLEYVFRSQEYT